MTQNPPVIAALTGSIGSGKSLAAAFFEKLGAVTVDADILAREAVAPGTPALAKIADIFGADMLQTDGTLDRRKLGVTVFNDDALRKKLESIIHPVVRTLFLERLASFRAALPAPLFLYVVPLLFEVNNPHPEIQKIITVSAPTELCIRRIIERDGSSEVLARRKLASQIPAEEKEKRSDFVIQNDGTKDHLERQVKQIYATLTGTL